MNAPTYEEVITSDAFRQDLHDLNAAIAEGLQKAGQLVAINGNVCYTHMLQDFHLGEPSPVKELKWPALHHLSKRLRPSWFPADVYVPPGSVDLPLL